MSLEAVLGLGSLVYRVLGLWSIVYGVLGLVVYGVLGC